MGTEYFVCCDDCKEYYHLGKHLRHFGAEHENDWVPWAMWEFVAKHDRHRIWVDVDSMNPQPVFCMPEYKEVSYEDLCLWEAKKDE